MDRDKLKLIIRTLKLLLDSLESEVYSDVDPYNTSMAFTKITDYDEVFDDDDGYPD